MKTGILVLAAGKAARFGTDKRLATMSDGRRTLDVTLANARASGLPLSVCLRPGDDQLAQYLGARGFACLRCSRADEGMGATLAQGAANIRGWDAVLVALADMPWVAPASFRAVAAGLAKNCIVVPVCAGRRGHPVGFGSDFFRELASLGGDTGARVLLDRHPQRVRELSLEDAAIVRDIDVPADLTSRD